MPFYVLGQALCGDEVPYFLGIFDFSVAPPLLFYSYIPIAIASLCVGVYIYLAGRRQLQNILLFCVTVFFALWTLNILIQWVASYHTILLFAWQLTALFEAGLYISSLYFGYVFLYKRDLPFWAKTLLAAICLGIIAVLPSTFNVASYDIQNCEGINGPLWFLIYGLEPAVIVLLALFGLNAYRSSTNKEDKIQAELFTLGSCFFLSVFYVFNYYGELTRIYEFNLWGPVGLLLFLSMIGYMTVRFKTFNAKIIGAQALVFALVVLIGSQFFFVVSPINHLLVTFTFLLALGFGYILVRSVRAEVRQRELIETQEKELEIANKRQENLLHFISHEVKGYLTESEAGFSSISEGDYEGTPPKLKEMAGNALKGVRRGVRTVMEILDASNLKKGTVNYKKESFDLKEVVQSVASHLKRYADEKGLAINLSIGEGKYTMTGDEEKLKQHVVRNLIDNAIKYTPKGTIEVTLTDGDKLRFSVKDSGVGITDEDKKNLFTEGGHGKDSIKVNVHSTGYGLFIAKQVVDMHGGKIWAESEGQGKGSTFVVEFPIA